MTESPITDPDVSQPRQAELASSRATSWRDYLELGKPRVVALIVFTAAVGMFLAVPGLPPLDALVFGMLGIGLAASSAAAINHVLDRRYDEKMARTARRPIPTGHVSTGQAITYAAILGTLSMLVLWFLVNPLTAGLTFASLIGYAILYTVWLKHVTPQNIVIGGAAGAAPPGLGWAAAVPDHLRLDAAALLGARDRPPRGLCAGRHPDAARRVRRRVHQAAHPALHDPALHSQPAAVPDRDERAAVPCGRRRAGRCLPALRLRLEATALRGTPAHEGLPLFDQLPDAAVRSAADRPLLPDPRLISMAIRHARGLLAGRAKLL
jgi:hypothetical protein